LIVFSELEQSEAEYQVSTVRRDILRDINLKETQFMRNRGNLFISRNILIIYNNMLTAINNYSKVTVNNYARRMRRNKSQRIKFAIE